MIDKLKNIWQKISNFKREQRGLPQDPKVQTDNLASPHAKSSMQAKRKHDYIVLVGLGVTVIIGLSFMKYRSNSLSGAVLSVKNLTSKPLELLELDFSNLFKNTVAINLGMYNGNALNVIKPRATMQVFIITREIKHD